MKSWLARIKEVGEDRIKEYLFPCGTVTSIHWEMVADLE
jgi:hypothetical protein